MTLFRFGSAALILLGIALVAGAPWPSSWASAGHIAVVGVLIQAVQFSGLYAGMKQGVPAGISALIVGTMPIFTALGAGWLLGEKLSSKQWFGLLLGLVGVTVVVWKGLSLQTADPVGLLLVGVALFGITAGTLYQKRFCGTMDLRTGGFVQLSVASVILYLLAHNFETMEVNWTTEFVLSVSWLSIINSIGAISLLYLMIRRGEASLVASLFYLIPPVTALMAAVTLGERPDVLTILGFAVAAAGVYISSRR